MSDKIYDFLPAHLRNKSLENIFDMTMERVFSKGSLKKTRAYVGRKEKGIYSESDIYLNYPASSYARKNYALEPVFTNINSTDNVFYDDLLNALYNKGALTNDHRRLFDNSIKTVSIPINIDKFNNFEMYYWVKPDFDNSIVGYNTPDYVTIEKSGSATDNAWSVRNSWYHWEDIRGLVTEANADKITQASRPIIEFSNKLELSDDVIAELPVDPSQSIPNGLFPKFKIYNLIGENYIDSTIFQYVNNEESYVYDPVLRFSPKVKSGDYYSEYVFKITVSESDTYYLDGVEQKLYIDSAFHYRNFREEIEYRSFNEVELLQEPIDNNSVDVFFDGKKQYNNYTVAGKTITFNNTVNDFTHIYIDYCTKDPVIVEGDGSFQRLNPSIEYNIDNVSHYNVELTYSIVYEHFQRIIETTPGLIGEAISNNNFRTLGDIEDHLNLGSVLIKSGIDIKEGYFAVTRDDYDPYKSVEFLSTAYSNYKNRLITVLNEKLKDPGSTSKPITLLLDEVIESIAKNKESVHDIFSGIDMLVYGQNITGYEEKTMTNVVGSSEQFMPQFSDVILYHKLISVYVNGEIQRKGIDYSISDGLDLINFTTFTPTADDVIKVRYYFSPNDAFIPPSAVKLGISPLYKPHYYTDNTYNTSVRFLRGHDGSSTPVWEDDIVNSVLYEFETRIFNYLIPDDITENSDIDSMNYFTYKVSNNDYSNNEKNYIIYPMFKRWMLRNNIDNMYNSSYNLDDWKTWNYKTLNDELPGNWRGIHQYLYGTDNILEEPWRILKKSAKPNNFNTTFGSDYTSEAFWDALIAASGADVPNPINTDGSVKTISELLFNDTITPSIAANLDTDWEFGDGSPVEMAWKRTSEYPFMLFFAMITLHPFKILDEYKNQVTNIIKIANKRDDINTDNVLNEKRLYTFKLGSKLAGFVNNFKIFSENSELANSKYAEIPSDNYRLLVHAGEPNRSETLSAIVVEKISLDKSYPKYDLSEVDNYNLGDIVYNISDKKYYRRKHSGISEKEQTASGTYFDYSSWVLISRPDVKKFGYRIHGYDELNPVFFTLDWDRRSKAKTFSTDGVKATIKDWQQNSFYKLDTYALYNNQLYICLRDHTATTLFDDNIKDWKQVSQWPRTNQVIANGYEMLQLDQVKHYNYGQIIENIDDLAHLMVGYQGYLNAVGWEFTDQDNEGNIIDYERLLYKLLEWTAEKNDIGDFITLTPILKSGSFAAPYGVASVGRETNKNFFRVLDSSGKKIPDNLLEFFHEGEKILFNSDIPIYSIKIDVLDIEHAFVLDRVDSYGDIIFDPVTNNRNLRVMIDCNRTEDWDGTLKVQGYFVYDNKIVPNFEKLVDDSEFFRDTLVDQNLEIINKLKASHIGFSNRDYLDNQGMERESQLEFYKGFLGSKATSSSINRLVNSKSMVKDVTKSDVWAIKTDTFGRTNSKKVVSKNITVADMRSDPLNINLSEQIVDTFKTTNIPITGNFKNSGYVDPNDVNHIVISDDDLYQLDTETIYEGDIAWTQFHKLYQWDVNRLSEIAEILYLQETPDSQLKIAITNDIETNSPVFLKIKDPSIDPQITDYFYLIYDETTEENGISVYKYLVFHLDYEPLIVEIDSSTVNSAYQPPIDSLGVEAVSSVSNPDLVTGDILNINGTDYTFVAGASSAVDISIGGDTATDNPIVATGSSIRLLVKDETGIVQNTNTVVEFYGTSVSAVNNTNVNFGDTVSIDGIQVSFGNSTENDIVITSSATTSTQLTSGNTLILNGVSTSVQDLTILGTVSNPKIIGTKGININGVQLTFTPPSTNTTEIFSETGTVSSIQLSNSLENYVVSDVSIVLDGVTDSTTYTVNYDTGEVSFTNPLIGTTIDITVSLSAASNIVDVINVITSSSAPVTVINNSGNLQLSSSEPQLTLTGTVLIDLGLSTTSSYSNTKLKELSTAINVIAGITSIINENNRLEISCTENQLIVDGTLVTEIGISAGTYDRIVGPTLASVIQDITDANIPLVSASSIGGLLNISKDGENLTITEVTSGAMARLGFETSLVTATSIDMIISRISTVINSGGTGDYVTVSKYNGSKVLITSTYNTVEISNFQGTPLDDIGITAGTYVRNTSAYSPVQDFKNQINEQATDILVTVTSDGRMVFTSEGSLISFALTSDVMLTKLGLYDSYTNVKSNANFKIMRWKPVRFIKDDRGTTFEEFYQSLGLNDSATIWVDDYNGTGWAVIARSATGNLVVKNRQIPVIDTSYMNRVVIQDGETFYNYQIYDPLNMKLPGTIVRELDYITWIDPAKYSLSSTNSDWLDDKVGSIWWNTSPARFYRYNDYGTQNGLLDINYAKKFWGKLVPGSEIKVLQWVKRTVLADGVTAFNRTSVFDISKNKNIEYYYYWEETTVPEYDKNYSTTELSSILQAGGPDNRFIPSSENSILISNNSNRFETNEITVSLEYTIDTENRNLHSEWEMVSETNSNPISDNLMIELQKNLSGIEILDSITKNNNFDNTDPDYTFVGIPFIDSTNINDVVITVNGKFVDMREVIVINNGAAGIPNSYGVIDGDVVRAYKVKIKQDNWFKDMNEARSNMASVLNEFFEYKQYEIDFPKINEYISLDEIGVLSGSWYLTDDYKTIDTYSYLSRTETFDMISLFNNGVKSFKVIAEDGKEKYYFEHDGVLRMVHCTKSAIVVDYLDIDYSGSLAEQQIKEYGVQINELILFVYNYAGADLIKKLFLEMVKYLVTEKTYPDWLFKTSYIDVNMFNRTMKQYAMYQRDSYGDMIEYINETKPYHTKIRTTNMIYDISDEFTSTFDIFDMMHIVMDFGNYSRYTVNTIDGGDKEFVDHSTLSNIQDGEYDSGKLLRNIHQLTNDNDGFDTGLVKSRWNDSAILFVKSYEDEQQLLIDKQEFHVYDSYGRGWIIESDKNSTISNITTDENGDYIIEVAHQNRFLDTNGEMEQLVAVETANGIEFLLYDKKDGIFLHISKRAAYDETIKGVGIGNKIHSIKNVRNALDEAKPSWYIPKSLEI